LAENEGYLSLRRNGSRTRIAPRTRGCQNNRFCCVSGGGAVSVSYAPNQHRFEKDTILLCAHRRLASPLSYRNLKEMMLERGAEVDHSDICRWVQKFTPQLEAAFRKGEKRAVGNSWRKDETYIKVKGQGKHH
jgi:transposase-like protein